MSRKDVYLYIDKRCVPLLAERLKEKLNNFEFFQFDYVYISPSEYWITFYHDTNYSNFIILNENENAYECTLKRYIFNFVENSHFHGYTDEELKIKEIIE